MIISLLTAAALVLRLNSAGAGFVLLVGIFHVASRYPLGIATFSAIAATTSYNYFFFPPHRTLTIDDPENWIALAAFLVTSLLANRLLVRERTQAGIAWASREEVEALYALSLSLYRSPGIDEIGEAAIRYLGRIGARSGGVILFGASPQHQKVLVWIGEPFSDAIEELAAGVARHDRMVDIPSRFGRDVCIPMTVSGRVRAALVARSSAPALSALTSAASLLAFAIDRDRFLNERVQIAALRATNELETSLLQAVSHDLKSPLTVLAVESEVLQRSLLSQPEAASHARVIRDEVARLHRRIENLLSIARSEAGIRSPRAEPTPPADLFRAARESLPTITAARTFQTTVREDTPDVLVDPSIALEIIINLIENADRAAPAGSAVELRALPATEVDGRVWMEVRDGGAGLTGEQSRRLRTIGGSEGSSGRGLGIELVRRLASLSGGSVEWFDRRGGGTIARLELPSAPIPSEGQAP